MTLQAATYCAPTVAMYNLRYSVSFAPTAKSKPGELWRFTQIATPEVARQTHLISPNVNVLYGFGFVDLRREPVILSVPDSHGRYYMVQMVDMWTNSFAYAGGTATGYGEGKFALVGPGWHGTLPPGLTRIEAPTPWVELQPRVFVKDQADLAAAKNVLDQITITGLAEYEGRPAPAAPSYDYPVPELDPNIASSKMPFKDPMQFWTICSAAMNENPPPQAQIEAVLPQYSSLGLQLGKQWTPQNLPPLLAQAMKDVASQIGGVMANAAAISGTKNGWAIPPYDIGDAGADYPTRAIVAVVGLLANTANEAVYYDAGVDDAGEPLTGAKNYTLSFTGDMSYLKSIPSGFWSLTMYDAASGFTIDNPIHRYALGTGDNLKKNADGSFTIYVQHDDPGPDKQSNWLPAPQGRFYVLLRNYAPIPAVYEGLKHPATFVAPPAFVPEGDR
jgi:DNA sulfur modification protein DndE